jgi:YggT family protein
MFILSSIFNILYILILVRVIMSWIRPNPYHPLVQIVYQFTEPIMVPARRLIPPMNGIDFSPMVVLIALSLIQKLILSL